MEKFAASWKELLESVEQALKAAGSLIVGES